MPKKPRVRTLMDSEHVKGSETLHECACNIFVMFFDHSRKEISSKNLSLVVSEILRLLVDILTRDHKYSLSVKASV